MDTLVENTGVAHQEKATPVTHAEHEHIISVENTGTPVALLGGEGDGIKALDQEPAVIAEVAADEIVAGYRYAFGRR